MSKKIFLNNLFELFIIYLTYFSLAFIILVPIVDAPISPLIAAMGVYPGQPRILLQTLFSNLCNLFISVWLQDTTEDANNSDGKTIHSSNMSSLLIAYCEILQLQRK